MQKQLNLFHGTRNTDPKLIYEDRQDCFNINYSGENNLLGKGIYFAAKPEYSVGYSFKNKDKGIFSSDTKSMFYCEVIVG